ncbi:MAG: phosphotransferase family protein [Rhodospirillaceae bacterium]|nr:phosphotransferase family protein [Rhodospirillaceae bacterium]
MNAVDMRARVAALPCWSGPVDPQPLAGGISNVSFLVTDGGARYVVRLGDDVPEHGVVRARELAASRAAHAAGLSPEVVHAEPGVFVLRYIDGRTLTAEDVRTRPMLERIVPLLHACHRRVPEHLRGPAFMFWVFHAMRDYAARLREKGGRLVADLPRLMTIAEALERAVGPIDVVYAHNDLLAANLIDDGSRLWLIDWEYGGYNSPLFDLGNLASNNGLAPADEEWLLEAYFERPVSDELRRRYSAMKCASLLREAMWSMVSEIHSTLDFDYVAYTDAYLARFEAARAELDL